MAQSSDPALLQLAREILAAECVGIEVKRMVINYAPVRRRKAQPSWDNGVMDVTAMEWDEFQAATAEITADGCAIYFNAFRLYHSAQSPPPNGRWQLHNRFRGASIREARVDS